MAMDTLAIVLGVLGTILHLFALYLSSRSMRSVLGNRKNIRRIQGFWLCSAIGITLLMGSSITELAFFTSQLVPLAIWTPLSTLTGDLFVQTAIVLLSSLRFWRLSRIVRDILGKVAIGIAAGILTIAMSSSIVFGTVVRMAENNAYSSYPPPPITDPVLLDLQRDENVTSFVASFISLGLNIGSDIAFFHIVSSRTNQKQKRKPPVYLYMFAICIKLVHMAVMISVPLLRSKQLLWVTLRSLSFTLARFTPSLETYVFYTRSIPLSRALIQSRKTTQSTPGIETSVVSSTAVENVGGGGTGQAKSAAESHWLTNSNIEPASSQPAYTDSNDSDLQAHRPGCG